MPAQACRTREAGHPAAARATPISFTPSLGSGTAGVGTSVWARAALSAAAARGESTTKAGAVGPACADMALATVRARLPSTGIENTLGFTGLMLSSRHNKSFYIDWQAHQAILVPSSSYRILPQQQSQYPWRQNFIRKRFSCFSFTYPQLLIHHEPIRISCQ